MKFQVLGVVVLRIAQELGSKGSPEMGGRGNMEGSEMGGRRNVGGSEIGNRGSMVPEMGGSRGRKYETADDGCTNRGFSGQPDQIMFIFRHHGLFEH